VQGLSCAKPQRCEARIEGRSAAEPEREQDAADAGQGVRGAACPRRSEGLHVIPGEETRFLAHDALAPAVRVPPRDEEEGAGLEGELVVLLLGVGVEGHHCERRERGAVEPTAGDRPPPGRGTGASHGIAHRAARCRGRAGPPVPWLWAGAQPKAPRQSDGGGAGDAPYLSPGSSPGPRGGPLRRAVAAGPNPRSRAKLVVAAAARGHRRLQNPREKPVGAEKGSMGSRGHMQPPHPC